MYSEEAYHSTMNSYNSLMVSHQKRVRARSCESWVVIIFGSLGGNNGAEDD